MMIYESSDAEPAMSLEGTLKMRLPGKVGEASAVPFCMLEEYLEAIIEELTEKLGPEGVNTTSLMRHLWRIK